MQPEKIKVEKQNLIICWKDGSQYSIALKYLRDECPCANCKGETILLHTYKPLKLPIANENMYKVKKIELVGGYAIQITWKDEHNTGIYSWEYLKNLQTDQASSTTQTYDGLL
jgi:DUF971 family protein